MYRIREVDGNDDEIADTLADIHRLTFFDGASIPEFGRGHWWLAYREAGGFCRGRSVDLRLQCGVFLPCRRIEERLRKRTSIALNARAGIACAPKWMERRDLGHYGQSCLREQFYPRRLSAVPAANSMGMAKHIVLAQIHQVKSADVNSASSNQSNEGGEIPRLPKLARSPGGRNGHRAFLGFPGSRRLSACRSKARSLSLNGREDEDHLDDEERRGDGGRGEQPFHDRHSTGEPAFGNVSP
jgi:hypothetical protein